MGKRGKKASTPWQHWKKKKKPGSGPLLRTTLLDRQPKVGHAKLDVSFEIGLLLVELFLEIGLQLVHVSLDFGLLLVEVVLLSLHFLLLPEGTRYLECASDWVSS